MTPISSKPIDRIIAEDINRLIAEAPPEGGSLEFKEGLPARDGADVAWNERSEVTPFARNKLLQEVVAFANAYGGDLALGVRESEEKPSRAAGLVPIPNCNDLAERLRLQARDCIEPQIPLLQAAGIRMEPNGSGVVVVRVPQSRMAPHRLKSDNECYVRRADRTEKMTMREIQDLTLRSERGLAALEKRFEKATVAFRDEIGAMRSRSGVDVIALRATLVPVAADLNIPHVYRRPQLAPRQEQLLAQFGTGDPFLLEFPNWPLAPQPILRGARCVHDQGDFRLRQDVGMDGRVELIVLQAVTGDWVDILPASWLLGYTTNAMLSANAVRNAAGVPDAEYGLEVEIAKVHGTLRLGSWVERQGRRWLGEVTEGVLFPRYGVGPYDDFADVTEALVLDLYNAVGKDLKHPFRVEFPAQEP